MRVPSARLKRTPNFRSVLGVRERHELFRAPPGDETPGCFDRSCGRMMLLSVLESNGSMCNLLRTQRHSPRLYFYFLLRLPALQ